MKGSFFYILFCVFLAKSMFSTHIVGGEIIYDHLGSNNYKITLKVYRDCFTGLPGFDGGPQPNGSPGAKAYITVIEGVSGISTTYDIGAPVITAVPPTINSPCIKAPNTVCVEEGVYNYTINLPPIAGGYYVVYQRCCRNNSILNLVLPGDQGSTYYTKIPGPEEIAVNSSPRFKKFPPIFICNNVNFTFDHSATDPDGDQLVYSFYEPFKGLSSSCPVMGSGIFGCPNLAPPPPYSPIDYASTGTVPASYSGNYPIASNPAFNINSITGELSGTPNLVGQFVVGVCVKEYRGGVLIDTHYRDFQFNVVPCIVNVISSAADQIRKCMGDTIRFINKSQSNIGALTYLWDFGVVPTATSSLANPTFIYPGWGQYTVTLIANPNKPCTDTFKKVYYVYPPLKVSFDKQDRQCLKGNSFNFKNTGKYYQDSATFNWNFSSAATPSASILKDPTGIVYNQAGKYFVKLVSKQLACRDSMIDTIRVLGRPTAKINNLPSSFCDPASVGFSNGSSGDLPMNYKWTFSNGTTSTDFEPVKVFSPAGIYGATLMATSAILCLDTSITSVKNITVNPKPAAGFDISPTVTTIFDPEITIKYAGGEANVKCNYAFGDGNSLDVLNCVYVYQNTGTYTITQIIRNTFDCTDTAQKEIRILPEYRFWVPNTFTPNGDGSNDVFMPKGYGLLDYKLDIFNRWGERVYTANHYLQGWDGYYKNQVSKQDVYVWKISFTNEVTLKREYYCGHVTLLNPEN